MRLLLPILRKKEALFETCLTFFLKYLIIYSFCFLSLFLAGSASQCYVCNNQDAFSQGYVENVNDCVTLRPCQNDEVQTATYTETV